jgi:hypothetical protein
LGNCLIRKDKMMQFSLAVSSDGPNEFLTPGVIDPPSLNLINEVDQGKKPGFEWLADPVRNC